MNQKILILFSFVLLFSITVNAAISNPSFETQDLSRSGNAQGWDQLNVSVFYQQIYDNNAGCYNPSATAQESPDYYGRINTGTLSAPDGNNFFFVQQDTTSKATFLKSDFYIGTLNADTNIYWNEATSTNDSFLTGLGVYQADTNIYCRILGIGNLAGTSFANNYRTIPAGTYNGYLTFEIIRIVGVAGDQNIYYDNFGSGSNLDINILNGTSAYSTSNSTVVFKTKVLRADLNQFITDANVQLYSADFNSTMSYNSSTGYYEVSRAFGTKLGAYQFTVIANDVSGDLNYLNNSKTFSTIFRKTSSQLSNVDNAVINEEYQYSSTVFSGIISPSDNTKNLIYKFTGQDTNASGVSIDFNFTIRNSDLSGKRYSVYTASESDYENGIWNFDSTLNFGATVSGGVQKIWVDQNDFYKYSFVDSSLLSNEIKYYRLVYEFPYGYWSSLHPDYQSIWDVQYIPSVFESDAGHKRDYYSISSFNPARNEFKNPLPDINSNTTYSKFLLVFNAQTDSAFTMYAGSDLGGNNDSVSAVAATGTETTFHVSTGFQYPLIKADSSTFKQLMLSDYALVERGFFVEPITLLNNNYTPIERVLVNGSSAKVIREGEQFRIESSLYNKDGKLDFLEGRVYFGSVSANNQVAYFKKDLNALAADEIYNLDWLVDGIMDLNGTTARDFVVVLKATTNDGDWFEIQTDTFKLTQFPSYPDEFNLNFYITNKKVGEHLRGVIQINTEAPETLRGLNLRLWKPDSQTIEAPDYNTTLWKDQDFTCTGFQCTFDFEFIDHVLDSQAIWALNISALLTTQLEDTNNFLTSKTLRFSVYYTDFNQFMLVETIERPNHDYRHNEPIPFTLMLVPSDKQPTKNELKIVLRAANCSTDATGGTCTDIDINYAPDSYVYDASTGVNYYFWRQIYVDSDLSLFDDADYYRFYAVVESVSGKISQPIKPLLVAKCQTYLTTDFWQNALNVILDGLTGITATGCTVYSDANVSIDNNSQESRILIDRDKQTTKPNLECSFCVNPDQNNNYVDNLKQDMICGAYYTFNESAVDKFDFYLTNKNSDLSVKEDDPDSQYIKATLPFSLVALNDLSLMKQSLAAEYGTQATTIGGLVQQGINHLFTGFANPISDYTENTMQGLINDAAYDCNFTAPLDPTYIGGMVFFKLNGINTLNQQDFVYDHPEIKAVQTNQLVKYLDYEGISYSVKPTTIDMYGSDMTKLLSTTDTSPLVINEEFDESEYQLQTAGDVNQQFKTLPTKLYFNVITDLVYDDETKAKRLYVPITITAVLSPRGLNLSKIWSDIAYDPVQAIVKNWFVILVIMVMLLWAANVRYKWVKAGGGDG